MGLKDKMLKKSSEITNQRSAFTPLELNEGNVQAIFNRCLAKDDTTEKVSSILYYKELGYEKEDLGISFDKVNLIANKKSIEYLYGQLASVHDNQTIMKVEDFAKSYLGHTWTTDKASLMQLIYLGSSKSEKLLTLFNAKFNGTSLYAPIKPTLSPKDPNFPAWWEEHKAEWEEPKKEGQEPADD